ncbi:penicillin-binding protein 1A [Alteromonadaceae bacterium 2753L.S.0a.02]|nr:penicillin-binding protein 1A [Alteromonadaceae bacterium 2753L.S.0a.02]
MNFKKPYFIVALWLLLAGIGTTMCVLAGMYLYLSPQLPPVDILREVKLQTPLRVYSSDNKLIAEFGEKRRTPVIFSEIPTTYVDALLAAEDDDFFEHSGVSIKGLMRAATQLITTGRRASGGSTITMQVARNYYLSRRKTFARKFNEILLALRIEQELSKEEILELYVNVIFLGNRAYGIKAASQVYYGKPLNQLSLAQIAMIAGLPKGPSTMNPIANPSRAVERRNWILGRMLYLEKINEAEYEDAIAEPVTAEYHSSIVDVNAPYVAEMARSKAIELYGLDSYTEGYKVYTTIDSKLQNKAQQAIIDGLMTYDKRHGYRGPEQQWEPLPDLVQPETPTPTSDAAKSPETKVANAIDYSSIDLSEWLEKLGVIPEYGGLRPAVVIGVSEQQATALLANGEQITLSWKQGLSDAVPYINESVVGSKPNAADDIVAIGDVVRIRDGEEGPLLAQIPEAQAALVSLAPDNGAIRSLVGGFDFNQSHFNRATQAKRQPGSNFKPFIYTSALENGMTAATIINDAPFVVEDATLESTWRPQNDGGRFDGPTRLRRALYRSRNLVSVRILREIGISTAISGMSRFGFNEAELPRDLSLALGSQGLTPLEVATGYAVFANGGYKIRPYLIERIVDNDGDVVFEAMPETVCRDCDTVELAQVETPDEPENYESLNSPFEFSGDAFELPFPIKQLLGVLQPADYPHADKVVDDRVVYIMNSILRDVIRKGTGVRAKALGRSDLAGKTGTTNGPNDAWFTGFNTHLVTTTWLGFDQFSPLGNREYGGSAALPIWIDFMRTALEGIPEKVRPQPEGIVTVRIDPETGLRARAGDPDAIFEIFRAENTPQEAGEDTSGVTSPYDDEATITEELF